MIKQQPHIRTISRKPVVACIDGAATTNPLPCLLNILTEILTGLLTAFTTGLPGITSSMTSLFNQIFLGLRAIPFK